MKREGRLDLIAVATHRRAGYGAAMRMLLVIGLPLICGLGPALAFLWAQADPDAFNTLPMLLQPRAFGIAVDVVVACMVGLIPTGRALQAFDTQGRRMAVAIPCAAILVGLTAPALGDAVLHARPENHVVPLPARALARTLRDA